MSTYNYYQELIKPDFAPPAEVFGPVWSFLYILIAISFFLVFKMYFKKEIPGKIAFLFLINLISNFIYTPIQFGLKNNLLASIDILVILSSLFMATIYIYQYKKYISYMQIPYIIWVSFATILQITITYLNY
ncbi:MAG: tryptophan-rich sensory protein [Candidatus Gracilibacteria bacterium]|nr:tryptophan-rich sensory protein [Candidatus Gracilibacteria bacterium]